MQCTHIDRAGRITCITLTPVEINRRYKTKQEKSRQVQIPASRIKKIELPAYIVTSNLKQYQ